MEDLYNISEDQFKEYALEANIRSSVAAQDGLKPIHRRILYTLLEDGAVSNKPEKPSATLVGSVMKYHPHGDAAIYEAAIRMSQDFKMRYPLIDIHGGNGSIINDRYSASRYTKMRLSKIGELMLDGIKKNAIPMIENYSGDDQEPVYLPSIFPALLCNPNLGIGLGMSCNTLPHNLLDICNAIEAIIKTPSISIDKLMDIIQGPDFPTGGIIVNTKEELLNLYKIGSGSVKLSCKYTIEKIDGQQHIIITEIPYLVNIEKHIVEPIKKMVNEDGYEFIDDLIDKCGNGKIELHIVLSKNANIYQVQKDLIDNKILQSTIKVNQTINKNNNFIKMTIKDMIKEYLLNRHNCIKAEAQFEMDAALKKIHIIIGLIIALEDIDNVVQLIKSSKSTSEAKEALIKKYNLDEEQSKAILDMKLAKLTSLEIETVKQEKLNLEKFIENKKEIINNSSLRDKIILEKINELKKLSDGRRTQIREAVAKKADSDIFVIAESDGTIKALDYKLIPINNRGTKGNIVGKDSIIDVIKTKTNSTILLLGSNGYIYSLDTNYIPLVQDLKDKGIALSSICGCEKLVQMKEQKNTKFIIFYTANGIVKKSLTKEYNFNKEIQSVRVKEDDSLLGFDFIEDDYRIALLTKANKLVSYLAAEVKPSGRVTYGLKGAGIALIAAAASNNQFTMINSECKGKIVSIDDIGDTSKTSVGHNCSESVSIVESKDITVVLSDNRILLVNNDQLATSKNVDLKGTIIFGGDVISKIVSI